MAVTPRLSSFVQLPANAIGTRFSFSFFLSQSRSVSRFGFHPLRLHLNTPKTLIVRAARMESKGVTLGFRAPQFQVHPNPFFFFFIDYIIWTLNKYFLFLFFLCGWFGIESASGASYWESLDIGRFWSVSSSTGTIFLLFYYVCLFCSFHWLFRLQVSYVMLLILNLELKKFIWNGIIYKPNSISKQVWYNNSNNNKK